MKAIVIESEIRVVTWLLCMPRGFEFLSDLSKTKSLYFPTYERNSLI